MRDAGSCASAAEFLSAYFEGAGSISASFISTGSKSEQLIRQLQTLLLNFGIVSHLEQRDIPDYGWHYRIRLIGRESRELFARHIGFISIRKRRRPVALLGRRPTQEAIQLPRQVARLTRMYPQTKREIKETIHSCIRTKSQTVGLTYQRLGRILDQFPQPDDLDAQALREHQQRNLFYDTIASIELCQSQVYDLVVPTNHTYLANGFVSHNTVIFGVAYGISAFGLAPRINASRAEAQALIDGLFARFPGIRRYIDDTLARGRRDGYVESLFGRRRAMPDLKASGPRRAAAEREAINAPIQATAADIMKMAMIGVHNALRERQLQTRMLLQVHDEIILEAPAAEVATVSALLKEVMEHVYQLNVPLGVNVESGSTWDDMHDA
ncbi:hypothetical protein HC891_11865 [Candidatus Gracilibacteria bacterium]|nr:hypothetical protein [Candidatus Gracilibacteria bacterium]